MLHFKAVPVFFFLGANDVFLFQGCRTSVGEVVVNLGSLIGLRTGKASAWTQTLVGWDSRQVSSLVASLLVLPQSLGIAILLSSLFEQLLLVVDLPLYLSILVVLKQFGPLFPIFLFSNGLFDLVFLMELLVHVAVEFELLLVDVVGFVVAKDAFAYGTVHLVVHFLVEGH